MTKDDLMKLAQQVVVPISNANQALLDICLLMPTAEIADISREITVQMVKLMDILKREAAPYLAAADDIPSELFTQKQES